MIIEKGCIPDYWKELEREDLKRAEMAQKLGYNVEVEGEYDVVTADDVPLGPLSFSKKKKRIWEAVYKNTICWRCADIIKGRYCNHRTYGSIREALIEEK